MAHLTKKSTGSNVGAGLTAGIGQRLPGSGATPGEPGQPKRVPSAGGAGVEAPVRD